MISPVLRQTTSTYQLMVTLLLPLLGPKSLGLILILLSHSTYVNHQQVLLTYSSKYFQNLTTSLQLHCVYYGPSHYYILFLTVSDILPCLLIIYSSAVRAFLLKHESSETFNFLFYSKSKFHKSSPGSRGAGPFNTSLIISNYVPLPHTTSFGPFRCSLNVSGLLSPQAGYYP